MGAGLTLAVPVGGPSGFVTSAVPERKINIILSKTYFWTLLINPYWETKQSRTYSRYFSWQEVQVFIVDQEASFCVQGISEQLG